MDGQSYLLLIRDEGGPPELQVGHLSPPPTPLFPWYKGLADNRQLPGALLSAAQNLPVKYWPGPETPPAP